MFKPKNGRVIVELDDLYKKEIEIGGKKFLLDHKFRRMYNAVQNAIVVAADDNTELKKGDKVYVHHFVTEDEHRVPVKGKEYRWLEYKQIYCRVRNGILKTLSDFVLVEPIKYDESNFKKESNSGILLTRK